MEDWEYFAILEHLSDRNNVTALVSEVAPNWWASSEDPKQIQIAREKIASEIVRLRNEKK